MKLEDLRNEIDSIDREIVRLLNERAVIVRKIGKLKAGAGLPVKDMAREEEVLRSVAAHSRGILDAEAVVGIYRAILRESRNIQSEMKIKTSNLERVCESLRG